MPIVTMPDGTRVRFPDDMPKEQIRGLIVKKFPSAGRQHAQPGSYDNTHISQGMSGAYEGLANTVGAPVDAVNWAVDKGLGAVNAVAGTNLQAAEKPFLGSEQLKGWMRDAGTIAPESRDAGKQFARRVGQEIGTVAVPTAGMVSAGGRMLAKGAQLAPKAGILPQAARAAAENPGKFALTEAGLATTSGIGAAAAQQLAPNSVLAEITGQAVGGLAPLGIAAMTRPARVAQATQKQNPRLTADDLGRMSKAAYDSAESAGVIFRPEMMQRMRRDIRNDLTDFGYHPANHPGAKVALDELDRIQGENITLKGLDVIRQITSGGYKPTEPKNNAIIAQIIDNLDRTVANLRPEDVLVGDTKKGLPALKEGRELWARKRKLDLANSLLERAELNAASSGSGGNIENATRQQLKRALLDPKMKRSFNTGEQQLLRRAVVGTKGQDLLRLGGKFSPSGNGLMAYLMGAGAALEPTIGIPAMALGYASKKGAEALSKRSVNNLIDAIVSGRRAPTVPRTLRPQQESALQTLLIGHAAGQNRIDH